MADPRIYYDPKTKKIVRTEPPELMEAIRPIAGTSLVAVPSGVYDLARGFRAVSVQVEIIKPKHGTH